MFYYWFQFLITMRYYTEILSWHIGMASHWRADRTGEIFIWPWYYKLVNYPTVWTWYYINFLMQQCEWAHPWVCDPDTFMLPPSIYHALDMDFNYN